MKEKVNSDESQVYEVGFHILPTVPEEKVSEELSAIEDVISKNGGSVIAQDLPKMRALAYDITKMIDTKYLSFSKAYFGWVKFEIEREAVSKIKNALDVNPNILRFIIVKTVKENTLHIPKAPMISKNTVEESKAPKVEDETVEKVEISEEEIDKSIDELLVDEKVEN